ncbi:MAG TPA: hypothetical protein VNI54_02955 [Thermoanaerobaculia bacterium]|nr:hypothetical protein [Thermoanaerobaculia bacterium]
MGRRIEHALVMDTDHLPGGGGYAVAGFSDGVSEPERLFIAQNFGISDFLHDPQNARVYFSFFRVPNGRFAFVRRFAQGRRRSGVQNRLFVHTLFLDEATLDEVHHLPWLLAAASFRVGRADPAPLTLEVAPLLADPAFPPLEWQDPISPADAWKELQFRAELVERKLPGATATELEALSRRTPAVLPQGAQYEQLSLVVWSMLPPRDRESTAWTQHDAGNVAGVAFGVSNAPSAAAYPVSAATSFRRIVALHSRSATDWLDYQSQTREYNLSITSASLFSWLDFQEANAELFSDPSAPDDVIVARLTKLASAMDERRPWVNERAILRAVWSLAAGGGGVDRAIRLFTTSGIGTVVFREPPSRDWLSASESQVGAEAVTRFFVETTRHVPAAAATREAVASWLLERKGSGVTTATLVRLAALLDQSLVPILRLVLDREDGAATLIATWKASNAQLGRAIRAAVELTLASQHPERKALIRALVGPQLAANDAFGEELAPIAGDIGELLRDDPDEFVRFVRSLPRAAAARVNESVATWLKLDPEGTRPLVRRILSHLNEQAYPEDRVLPAVFLAARSGEPVASWWPFVSRTAELLDARGDSQQLQYFTGWTKELVSEGARLDREAMPRILDAFRQRVGSRGRVGPALRALLEVVRPEWGNAGSALYETLDASLQNPMTRAVEWEQMVMAMTRPGETRAQASLLATFWRRLDAKDVPVLQERTLGSLAAVAPEHRETVVVRWINVVRNLPANANCEELLRLLSTIVPPAHAATLQIEEEWRELRLGRGTVETLMRLDKALYDARRENRAEELRVAVPYLVANRDGAPERAAELIHIAAARRTLPTTRRVIETELLRPELAKLRGDAEWQRFLTEAAPGLFVWRNLTSVIDVSLRGAKKAEQAATQFSRMSQKAGRH